MKLLLACIAVALLLTSEFAAAFDQNPPGVCVDCTSSSSSSRRDESYGPPPPTPPPTPQPPAPGELSFTKGEELFQAGNYEAAVVWLERAVRDAPNNARYRKLLADCREEHRKELERERLAREMARVRNSTLDAALNQQRSEVISEALGQLSSIEKSSVRASGEATDEAARDQAACGFNRSLCAKPDKITIALAGSGGTRLPAVVSLKQKIPERYRGNEQVKQSVAWFTKLEILKVETRVQLAQFNDEIASGNSPMGIFAKVEQLRGKLLTLENDQKNAKKTIETIVKVQLD